MCDLRQPCAHTHEGCPYHPCHEMPEGEKINCGFCICPLYSDSCQYLGGNPRLVGKPGHLVKDCSQCIFPHLYENEQKIWDYLRRRR